MWSRARAPWPSSTRGWPEEGDERYPILWHAVVETNRPARCGVVRRYIHWHHRPNTQGGSPMKTLLAVSLLAALLSTSMAFAFELPTSQLIKGIEGPDVRHAAVQPVRGVEGP